MFWFGAYWGFSFKLHLFKCMHVCSPVWLMPSSDHAVLRPTFVCAISLEIKPRIVIFSSCAPWYLRQNFHWPTTPWTQKWKLGIIDGFAFQIGNHEWMQNHTSARLPPPNEYAWCNIALEMSLWSLYCLMLDVICKDICSHQYPWNSIEVILDISVTGTSDVV